MSEVFKISGKKIEFAATSSPDEWKFSERPGGWIIAERRAAEGQWVRKKLAISEVKGRLSFQVDGSLYSGELTRKSHASGGVDLSGEQDLVAQFPGKVRKVLVKAGEKVSEGQPLLMVEAMKMEFPVKAPASGTVEKIHVEDGQQLSPGDRFVDFTPSGAPK